MAPIVPSTPRTGIGVPLDEGDRCDGLVSRRDVVPSGASHDFSECALLQEHRDSAVSAPILVVALSNPILGAERAAGNGRPDTIKGRSAILFGHIRLGAEHLQA